MLHIASVGAASCMGIWLTKAGHSLFSAAGIWNLA